MGHVDAAESFVHFVFVEELAHVVGGDFGDGSFFEGGNGEFRGLLCGHAGGGSGEVAFELEVFAEFFAVDGVVHPERSFGYEADAFGDVAFAEVDFVLGEVSFFEFGGEGVPFGVGRLDPLGDVVAE